MSFSRPPRFRRTILSFFVGIIAILPAAALLLRPTVAHAQFGGPVVILESIPDRVNQITDKIEDGIYAAFLGSLIQGASYFMRKLAYDTATYIGSGGKGQSPLAEGRSFGKYIEETAADSLAETIDQFGKGFGLDLCAPLDFRIKANIQIGLDRIYNPQMGGAAGPQPNCTWNEFKENFGKLDTGVGGAEDFYDSMQISQTDLGVTLSMMGQLSRIKAEKERSAEIESIVGRGFKPVTDLISGRIKTPAAVIEEETKSLTAKQQGEITSEQISGIYGAGAMQILPMAFSVFLNTLAGSVLDTVMRDGLIPGGTNKDNGTNTGIFNFYGQGIASNKKAAERAFSFFVTAVPVKQQNIFPVIAEFAACDTPGVNNCVIDSGLREALMRADSGKPLTIREAMDANLLHGDWPLLSYRRPQDNTDIKNCYLRGYCHSNVQKLRKLRMLPLGFEIAVEKSDVDQPWTLRQVVNGFDDCAPDGKPSAAHPFCRLIDPNWILRAPEARCEAMVYGTTLVTAGAPDRRNECVEISTCINEGPNGECLGKYGFCTKEENIWQLPGKSCEPQFSTCTTYRNTATNQFVSYLSRTVDYGTCGIDSVGCQAYSAEQANGTWLASGVMTADQKATLVDAGRTPTYYFNNKATTLSCPEGAEGCSAFIPALGSNGSYTAASASQAVFLKKAPDYLGCYDANAATAAIDLPKTKLDLASIVPNAACGKFASVCIEEEVGCEAYTPQDGGVVVPGIIGNGNSCNASCVGYDTFKQVATAFAPADYPVQFIPTLAKENMNTRGQVCSAQYVGCSEFTNIDEASQGGESLEYYTEIKYCERPTGDNLETYYSWEGSVNEGYVLRVHQLRPITASDVTYIESLQGHFENEFVLGSPAYADDSYAALELSFGLCNKAAYDKYLAGGVPGVDGTADASCRALYHSDGTAYYRLLSKTITVDASCHPLRKTETNLIADTAIGNNQDLCVSKGGFWDGNTCQRCAGGGTYEGGSCVYWAINSPTESVSCPAAANSCRQYVGNAGNNVEIVVSNDFEPPADGALAGWSGSGISMAAEAIQVGMHSLRVDTNKVTRTVPAASLYPEGFYELTFWARGTSQNLAISFEQNGNTLSGGSFTTDALTGITKNVSIGASWQKYTVGPVEFTGNASEDAVIAFIRQGGGQYFIDNVELKRVAEHLYLIKDSWKTVEGYDVPQVCDTTPNDGLPGEALGCRAYTNSKGTAAYATGFDGLCRPQAVGCQAFFDTNNTVNEKGTVVYNAFCSQNTTGLCTLTHNSTDLGSCTVVAGESGCYVDRVVLPGGVTLDQVTKIDADAKSTLVVNADLSTPIFLTNTPASRCNSNELGCEKFGREEQLYPDKTQQSSYRFTDVYLINNPDRYVGNNGILCKDEQVGCTEFRTNNDVTYFKDPARTGNALCEYKTEVTVGGVKKSGWFLSGAGTCAPSSSAPGQYCKTDSECGGAAGSCENIGSTACYAGYSLSDTSYGIWSNNSDAYAGFVGQCAPQVNGCTELVDPADTNSTHPEGKPYYVIFDEQITARMSDCSEGVSLKEGCVLFNKTDTPNKLYSTILAEQEGQKMNPKYGFVPLSKVVDPATNNANIVLKVDRNRQCSEWLDCKTTIKQTDERGVVTTLCAEYDLCNEYSPSGQCVNWVERTVEDQHVILDEERYMSRGTSWYDEEYTGYSLYNKYPVDTYRSYNLSFLLPKEENNIGQKNFLGHEMSEIYFGAPASAGYQGCAPGLDQVSKDGQACGFDNGGRCMKGGCVYPTGGTFVGAPVTNVSEAAAKNPDYNAAFSAYASGLVSVQCKAYPEKDSPFVTEDFAKGTPKELGGRTEFSNLIPGFEAVNLCQNGTCDCSYNKAVYGNGVVTDYWDTTKNAKIPTGVCVGGIKDGQVCDPNSANIEQCGGGACTRLKETVRQEGFRGFCVEEDRSRPGTCLTWFPSDLNASGIDSYNNVIDAGYNPNVDAGKENSGQLYCIDSNAHGRQTYDTNAWYNYTAEFGNVGDQQSKEGYQTLFGNGQSPKVVVDDNFSSGIGGWTPTTHPSNVTREPEVQGTNSNFILQFNSITTAKRIVGAADIHAGGVYKLTFRARHISGGSAVPLSVTMQQENSVAGDEPTVVNVDSIWRSHEMFVDFFGDPDAASHITFTVGNDDISKKVQLDDVVLTYTGAKAYQSGYLPKFSSGQEYVKKLYTSMSLWGWHGLEKPNTIVAKIVNPWRWGLYASQRAYDGFTSYKNVIEYDAAAGGSYDYAYPTGMPSGLAEYQLPTTQKIYSEQLARLYLTPLVFPSTNPTSQSSKVDMGATLFPGAYIDLNNLRDRAKLEENAGKTVVFDEHKLGNYYIKDGVAYTYENSNDWKNAMVFPFRMTHEGTNDTESLWCNTVTYGMFIPFDSASKSDGGARLKQYDANPTIEEKEAFAKIIERKNPIDALGVKALSAENSEMQYILFFWSVDEKQPNCKKPATEVHLNSHNGNTGTGWEARLYQGQKWKGCDPAFSTNVSGAPFGNVLDQNSGCIPWDTTTENLYTRHFFVGGATPAPGPALGYMYEMNPICTDYAQVHKTNTGGGYDGEETDKAWTNRVWEFAKELLPNGSKIASLGKDAPMKPYGSINMSTDDFLDMTRTKVFENREADGIPYSCGTQLVLGNGFAAGYNASVSICPSLSGKAGYTGYNKPLFTSAELGATELNQLFAKVFARKKQAANGQWEITETDVSGTIDPDALPPQIYALNPSTCFEKVTGGAKCTAGEPNHFTVNQKNGTLTDYDGDGFADEDTNRDGQPDVIIGTAGQLAATLSFFAFADDNHMPIRRVMINWGDGSNISNEANYGRYQNRKPYCAPDNETVQNRCADNSQLTCSTDSDCAAGVKCEAPSALAFGDAARACSTNYHEFNHSYTCGSGDTQHQVAVSALPGHIQTRLLTTYELQPSDVVCRYAPKVQVLDNWGWCNGTCAGGKGCYKDGVTDMCEASRSEPWTSYNGTIIVVPKQK